MSTIPLKLGVIGNGTVGASVVHTYKGWVDEVRVYDKDEAKATCRHADVLESDLIFVCLPEAAVDGFFQTIPHLRYGFHWHERNYVLKSTVPVGTTRRLAERYDLPN